MKVIYIPLFGCGICVFSSFILGFWLKKHPLKRIAQKTTIIAHTIFLFSYAFPLLEVWGRSVLPGYDQLLGIPLLPFRSSLRVVGVTILILGVFLMFISTITLISQGRGLPAVVLSEELAAKGIYAFTRNPMSLGFYLILISIGLLVGSTFFTIWSLIVMIPTHIFFLKFFEEVELEVRFGRHYIEYKNRVPFLIPNIRDVSTCLHDMVKK